MTCKKLCRDAGVLGGFKEHSWVQQTSGFPPCLYWTPCSLLSDSPLRPPVLHLRHYFPFLWLLPTPFPSCLTHPFPPEHFCFPPYRAFMCAFASPLLHLLFLLSLSLLGWKPGSTSNFPWITPSRTALGILDLGRCCKATGASQSLCWPLRTSYLEVSASLSFVSIRRCALLVRKCWLVIIYLSQVVYEGQSVSLCVVGTALGMGLLPCLMQTHLAVPDSPVRLAAVWQCEQ